MNPIQSNDLPKLDFVVLVSVDGHEVYLERKIANLSDVLNQIIRQSPMDKKYRRASLEFIRGGVLEVVVQYLHYKARYMQTDFEHNPPPHFEIEPKLALDVLKAAISLKI